MDAAKAPSGPQDARETKGRAIAKAHGAVKRIGRKFTVRSQASEGTYLVDLAGDEDAGAATCTCRDYEIRRRKCKHISAVEWSIVLEVSDDGAVTETRTVKVTYRQDWPAYNAAQCEEKERVASLLRSLCDGVVNPPHPGRGPKPLPLSDAAYAMAMKVYTTFSGRRASTDIRHAATAGHLSEAPHYNSVFRFFDDERMTPILTALVEDSAAPLAAVESKFAVDSTGFSTSVYRRWYDHKYGREMKEATWVKAHAIVGVHTNVITSIKVTDGTGADSPEFGALVASTAQRFHMREVSADKAYLSHDNLATVEACGAVPYIPFKINSQGDGSAAWRRMYGMFMYRSDEFLAHYHARSNVESTFSAIKRKFGGAVRSKRFTAQTNEVLCKALCFNLSMLVHAMREMGADLTFDAPKVH